MAWGRTSGKPPERRSVFGERGVLGIVGRNGMGKTTLCNAITGLIPARGSVRLLGEPVLGLAPNQI
ncbi:MAG TPA: ATP-binding cassette domain-containing protein, partial [Planctomycetota bacterium]|nr:ATP-binding cassette domain-containing protein [Planctomycetota bacterium]